MTDEQWLWLFVNQSIDYDEQLDHMCDKCRDEVTSHRCTRCGKSLGGGKYNPDFVNPNFDTERFDKLKNGTDESDDDIDYDLINQIIGKEGDTYGRK